MSHIIFPHYMYVLYVLYVQRKIKIINTIFDLHANAGNCAHFCTNAWFSVCILLYTYYIIVCIMYYVYVHIMLANNKLQYSTV